jgi:hypothetical protein
MGQYLKRISRPGAKKRAGSGGKFTNVVRWYRRRGGIDEEAEAGVSGPRGRNAV